MPDKVFVDSDIIIDLLTDRQPFSTHAAALFDMSEHKIVSIFTSTLCINNVHYITRKITGESQARKILLDLMEMIDVLDVTKQDIYNALNSDFNDFEDATQHSVAMNHSGIQSIITRNAKDYQKSQLSVFSASEYVQIKKINS